MYFCYPKRSNKTVASVIAALACRQLLPLTALQLHQIVHVMANIGHQNRLSSDSSCIRPGSSVELINLDTRQRGWLQLVNPAQASYRQSRISWLSPLGCALLGKTTEQDIQLTLLRQPLNFRVLSVLYVKHGKTRSQK